MPKAPLLEVTSPDQFAMDLAAMDRRRIRVRGVVAARGEGYSGRYRNVWLRLRLEQFSIQVTASPDSTLGGAPVDAEVDIMVTLTGLVDLTTRVYFGQRAKLVNLITP